jgi:5-methylcytosine-specific restriction endonuclease McrA
MSKRRRLCPQCGKNYLEGKQKLCSGKCRTAKYRGAIPAFPTPNEGLHLCPQCGKEYILGDREVCSDACRMAKMRQRMTPERKRRYADSCRRYRKRRFAEMSESEKKKLWQAGGIRTIQYRARRRKLPDSLTQEQVNFALGYWKGQCPYCGKQTNSLFRGRYHLDHFIPLSKGGGTTAENILPVCAKCNQAKKAQDVFSFLLSLWCETTARKRLKAIEAYFEIVTSRDDG